MNIQLNNHRNDVRTEDAIPAINHFSQSDHHFNNHAKFTISEQIKDLNKSKEEIRGILEDMEDFWILKLKTLQPHGLNGRLNRLWSRILALYLTFLLTIIPMVPILCSF